MSGAYLSICAIYRDEADYLREWVEFHRLVGVEKFFLYDNESADDHREVLAPYVAASIVVIHEWPVFPGQKPAYEHCLEEHRNDSRWITFLDLDEFLFSPTGRRLPELLTEYEEWPGVGVNRVTFGPSGHDAKPPGLVIENYLYRRETKGHPGTSVKSIVDPKRTVGCDSPHSFIYVDDQFAVDENKHPIDRWQSKTFGISRLRINHYATKSAEEWRRKMARHRADTGQLRAATGRGPRPVRHEFRDEEITAYLPALRDALTAATSRAST
jgi:hypothetical protein